MFVQRFSSERRFHSTYLTLVEEGRARKVNIISKVQEQLEPVKDVILFAHAMLGSDTTSAIYAKGKVSLLDS